MFIPIEKALFGTISQEGDYTVIGKFFHDMHANARDGDGSNSNFHPIAACLKASVIALALTIFGKVVSEFTPQIVRFQFRVVLEGAPLVYAASIIYTAVQSWSAATSVQTTEST